MKFNQIPEYLQPHVRKWSAMQLWLYCDVFTMTRGGKQYYRTNAQLAEAFGTDERTVRRIVSGFVAGGVLTAYQDGKMRILHAKHPDRWKEDSKVPGQQSPRTSKSAMEDSKVREGGQQSPKREDSKVPQVYQLSRPLSRPLSREGASLVFPWESDAFCEAWKEWIEYKQAQFKFKYKTTKSEQIALHKLHRDTHGDERNAIEAIASSIANGYRGIFPSNKSKGGQAGRNLNW